MFYRRKYFSIYLAVFITGFLSLQPAFNSAYAQQVKKPFSIDLGLGSGMIGNDEIPSALLPELEFSFIPGRYGLGLNTGFYSHDASFSPDQYRSGFEDFTTVNSSSSQWKSFFIGLGPRIEFGSNLPVQFKAGMDLSFTRNSPPQSEVVFSDETGAFHDVNLTLSEFSAGDDFKKWSTAIKPEFQVQFSPGRSQQFGFHITTGIQHQLSENSFTYSERDLSRVQNVDNAREMFFQFETAPIVERTEQAPKTNFFVNAGIKIKFGGSRAPAAPAQDYNSSRSNKPEGSIANDGGGDCDDDDSRCTPGSSRAQDYNSSRSNKPSSEAALGDVVLVKGEGLTMVDSFLDDIIEVLDRCEDEICTQVRQNADGRKDTYRQVQQNRISQDQGIEAIHSIVMEDVVSLQKCETDVCREVLTKEVQLLEHMNVLMNLVHSGRAAVTQYFISEWDELIDESVELAQDYNSSRSNKPSTRSDEIGDVEEGGSGQQVVLITQDGDGKVYAWGGEPEAIMQDENGKLYSWGLAPKTSAGGGEGMVYAWGVAPTASLQDGDGEVYCWGDNSKASLQDGSGEVYCWGDNSRASVDSCEGDSCPQPSDNSLFLAKEFGLASAGDEIENIKQVLDRCDEGVCGQVRLNADHRDSAVRSAQDNPSEFDTHIEEILNIVKEDVESLGKCETDVCREALAMEEKLLVKMNRLSDLAQIAPARDYNSSRSNKPSSRAADIGDGDMDSDDDGIDDGVDFKMARLANPAGLIVKTGMVAAGGKKGYDYYLATQKSNNPLYEGETSTGENPVYEGQANDGDSDDPESSNVQQYTVQPGSYCMEIGTNSQQEMKSNAQSTRGIDKKDIRRGKVDSDGFPDFMKSASFSISKRSARTGRNPSGDEDMDSDGDGIHFDLEIDPLDPDDDGDGIGDAIEMATYSISKRSARTGRNESQDNPLAQESGWQEATDLETAPPNNVHKWSYNLNSLADRQDIPGGTLTVLFTGGEWHFDVQVDPLDPDDDGDGIEDFIQNGSFSISKRSARTGRN